MKKIVVLMMSFVLVSCFAQVPDLLFSSKYPVPEWIRARGYMSAWFDWCEENEDLLKREFLRRIEEKEPLNPFFGSWYELFEKQLLGYCLGYKFVCWLEDEFSLERIAKLKREKIESKILEFLR
ncbi:conserved hypothetical protein [Thermotoga petrophila RKU-10]|jgi:hypothetical protein|uniref:Lipoprotein n=2 Tax=Thermotoga petrophila TaxID=93929 RepID=A5INF5_THEP1|nr:MULTISPECIES: hypothetical protein [Thermotoga]ABQ47728.1 hypothetical protein Tpet_1723 [Thermotoga petrophila RKU-1]ADA67804.1 conserved hypothetical protein [Thermotoga petrophila RKU-10]KAF2959209.1 hypothetical protein AS158_08975 [Thermotoga sp. 38H-to]KHC90835.1 hypothetical protein Mc24_06413 [Thermotoga sp. Mc24]